MTDVVIQIECTEEALADNSRNLGLFGCSSMIERNCFTESVHDDMTVLTFYKVVLYFLTQILAEITIHIIGKVTQQGPAF
jgi:hypothetical protein